MENNELKERFIDEKTGIEYIRKGDYYFPNLVDSASVNPNELDKYGKLRLKYLLEHKKVEYTILWVENKLRKHLLEIDKTANERFSLLMKQFAEQENITEELKVNNQMEWVCRMNNIKNRVEEIIFNELIYV
ncbi:MAG: TnpV protein [Clostridia bacterium]|nr:TnpV protein [Clostridia bacterium]